jgi:hypothetical protein
MRDQQPKAKRFEIVAETDIEGTPQQVFDAATTGVGGWLWPVEGEFEPYEDGSGPFGSIVTAWDPPHHFGNHLEGPNGFFDTLDYRIEERDDGTARLRYVHSGVIFDDWDREFDAARKHTDFYQHTLGQYVKYFPGRAAAFAEVEGPAASGTAEAFETVRAALGIGERVGQDDTVRVAIPGIAPFDAVVDYLDPHFIGLRTPDAMYRFFGRNAFGSVVGLTIHLFAPGAEAWVDDEDAAWQEWLDGLFA